ncbi:alpha/beta family hydrolase [Endozoicomonas numazuensis]|uniref:Alpha/beta hydrolase n=1 Tax=Endozoicomonas numazuensis TaxID=1137799 RepID=A0A081NFJ9_9GAMM|nr:alpha/beta family hydrolase [Endozoicomonas numazuensis]KEQ17222.1 alpha/beta hydrolase [Endozoicomonas numazuensis]
MNLIWNRAEAGSPLLILAHGAGAAMDSDFMNQVADLMMAGGVSVVRFEFPYMQERRETGKKRPPDRQPKLLQCWQEVIQQVMNEYSGPLFIGGKSMGGRMASLLVSECPDLPLSGVVCLGYPFYAPGKQDKPRTEHLADFPLSMLVVQGSRDAMGDYETVQGYDLSSNIQLHWLEDGNHDLKPRVKSGYSHEQHLVEAADRVAAFIKSRL